MESNFLNTEILIIGAGPTGLITAWKLLEANWDVTIIEKKKVSGGLCRSWKWKNFIIDTGPHIFHTPEKLLKEFWKKHFGDLLIAVSRHRIKMVFN